jgi:amidase
MECPLLVSGCRVDFPVFVEAGLLFIDDCHAAQSHGEITGATIKVTGTMRFTVGVKKNSAIAWPRGENHNLIFTIGSGRPLDIALQCATAEMLCWLSQEYEMTSEPTALRMSQGVQYLISNVVKELGTVACIFSKSRLK